MSEKFDELAKSLAQSVRGRQASTVTNFVGATGTNQFTDGAAPNFSRRFYRAVTP